MDGDQSAAATGFGNKSPADWFGNQSDKDWFPDQSATLSVTGLETSRRQIGFHASRRPTGFQTNLPATGLETSLPATGLETTLAGDWFPKPVSANDLTIRNNIISNSQIFKMGFFRPENSSKYYVGIMLNVPAVTGRFMGSIGISEDGNLVVLDGEKRVVWSSSKSNISISSPANTTAQLLDTGNLVLKDSSSGRYLWQSFVDMSCASRTGGGHNIQ
nr:G-type lectin S-receptor-like serine/threonine-protein kinase [Ipomoea batatas]